jgi:hypothetical protein
MAGWEDILCSSLKQAEEEKKRVRKCVDIAVLAILALLTKSKTI